MRSINLNNENIKHQTPNLRNYIQKSEFFKETNIRLIHLLTSKEFQEHKTTLHLKFSETIET